MLTLSLAASGEITQPRSTFFAVTDRSNKLFLLSQSPSITATERMILSQRTGEGLLLVGDLVGAGVWLGVLSVDDVVVL